MKRLIGTLYILVLLTMAVATVVERYEGTPYVSANLYGSWWFSLLWGVLAAMGLFWYLRHRSRRWSITLLHLSFAVILLGALLTHLTARRGMMYLRQGQPCSTMAVGSGGETAAEAMMNGGKLKSDTLPFQLTLKKFRVEYHSGTSAPADFVSHLTVTDGSTSVGDGHAPNGGGAVTEATVSMNNILTHRGYRFYQTNFDADGRGSVLTVYSDPWGIPVTYCGYALLFFALIAMLVEPKGTFRRLLKSQVLRRGALIAAGMVCLAGQCRAVPVLPERTAANFGKLYVLYNDRICPLQTLALDFTKKLCGKTTYNGLTAEQVLTGWMFWPEEWANEKCIKVKGAALKAELHLDDHAALTTFYNPATRKYSLASYVIAYYDGKQSKLNEQAAAMDSRLQLIIDLKQGPLLRLFPYKGKGGQTNWLSPYEELPKTMSEEEANFVQNILYFVEEKARSGDYGFVDTILHRLKQYQIDKGGLTLPTATQYKAERLYNAVPFATILFMLNLTLGLLALAVTIYNMVRARKECDAKGRGGAAEPAAGWAGKSVRRLLPALMLLSWLALTVALALRWLVSGHIPMGNGYETMLLVAWFVQIVALLVCRRARIVLVFGFLLSGFFLLVSHISQMDPAIGQMMPVLNSPLLSIHVSIVMMAYALLSLTFLCGLMGLTVRSMAADLQVLSQLFLWPAMTCLGLGIFIGAIWANVSWGAYWSWDPKETWALITMMTYAVPLHAASLPTLRRPLVYHAYLAVAFLSIIITYFGVNYFLGGMHSYA